MRHTPDSQQSAASPAAGPVPAAGGGAAASEQAQRREYVRVPASCPVELQTADRSVTVETYSIDVSGGGMLLAGPDTLSAGARIAFWLSTGDDRPPISGRGTVVRVGRHGERAVEIDEISDGNRRRLVRFVFDCQRLTRSKALSWKDRHDG
jgi:c-di-GMP-binding flagellar brake protein YcgR